MKPQSLLNRLYSVPVLGFLVRNWLLIIVALLALALLRWDAAREVLGVFVHLPLLASLVALIALLARHLVNRQTTEAYSWSGRLREEWHTLTPWQRVLIFKVELWVWLLVLAILAHSMLG